MQDTAREKTIEPGTRSPCGTETRRRTLRPMSSSPTLTDLRSLLPLYEASELLVDTYFDRVHWFMLIFQRFVRTGHTCMKHNQMAPMKFAMIWAFSALF